MESYLGAVEKKDEQNWCRNLSCDEDNCFFKDEVKCECVCTSENGCCNQ